MDISKTHLYCITAFIALTVFFLTSTTSFSASTQLFIGSAKCAECHEKEYNTFQQHSKKSQSWKNVSVMAAKLTPEELQNCYTCHTTGYGRGGFVDYATSPHLADVGCETCHGAGAAHAENGDPSLITRKPDAKTCQTCHDATRIRSFKRAPLMYSGAH